MEATALGMSLLGKVTSPGWDGCFYICSTVSVFLLTIGMVDRESSANDI